MYIQQIQQNPPTERQHWTSMEIPLKLEPVAAVNKDNQPPNLTYLKKHTRVKRKILSFYTIRYDFDGLAMMFN